MGSGGRMAIGGAQKNLIQTILNMPPTSLHIPSPCNATLERAQQGGSALFCATCQKKVHDLSDASDAEIVAFFEGQKSPVCARLRKSQIDRRLVATSTKKPPALHQIDVIMEAPREIIHHDFDSDMELFQGEVISALDQSPLQHAIIELTKSERYAITDENGYFALPIPMDRIDAFRIKVFRTGYREKRMTIKNYRMEHIKIIRLVEDDYCLAGDVIYHPKD